MVAAAARACPVCGGGRGRPIWQEDGHRYLRCAACATVWTDLSPADWAAQHHNVWDDTVVSAETEDFYGRARERAHEEFLGGIAGRPQRLLDVGCGLGYFLARARAAGWQVRGCDTSSAWIEATNDRLGGPVASLGELSVAIAPDERFELITAWDVVEHVLDPVALLADLASRLSPGGRIFLRTPNLAYVLPVYALRRRLGHDVALGPTNHATYFTSATLRRALARAGLQARCWPVLPPPQIETFAPAAAPAGRVVRLKNRYACAAGRLAELSHGRAVLGSDLDVIATAVSR
jgi:2-polyprenyl-3-methyl-5-hydroxy-6-metoxy-1,4-benzoquinol methylase